MARNKKPLEQHVIDGTYRPSVHGPLPANLESWRHGDGPAPGLPDKPVDLDATAAEMWDRVIATRQGTIWPSDGPMLKVFCVWWSLWEKASAKAAIDLTQQTFTPLGIATDKIEKLAARFGLSPKDRAALPVVQSGPKKAQVETRDKDIDGHLSSPSAKKKSRKGA